MYKRQDLSVAELAEKFHMSYSYFAAIFKEYYGQTCKEMILTVRLQKAEDLLQFTDFDLTYISQETGFLSLIHIYSDLFSFCHHLTKTQVQ